jgi:hypothetical protein
VIPGWIIAYLTFPGIIVHEAAHLLFCKLCRVPVLDVCFFRRGNPAGYVIHEQPKTFLPTFLITVGPFLVNSLLCLVICFPAILPIRVFHQNDVLGYFLSWLGISIGMHAFPSNQDAKSMLAHATQAAKGFNLLAILSYPLAGLIYLANLGSVIWLDYLYGLALGFGLPALLLQKL